MGSLPDFQADELWDIETYRQLVFVMTGQGDGLVKS